LRWCEWGRCHASVSDRDGWNLQSAVPDGSAAKLTARLKLRQTLYLDTMESIDFLRFASLCVLLAGTEMLHGIARTVLLAPRIGKVLAIKLSVVTGTLLAFGICYLFVPGVGAVGIGEHLLLGLGLSSFMATFDVAVGRLIMRLKWSRIWEDFDPRSGNYLSIGLVLLALSPFIIWWLRDGAAA
jgi:hypothetical protein